ncbi:DUF6520 family protein [Myroides sp. WP-1]|uniref:DUF6520 family protein n=1 Tax=Myroides sp. WP-1 TaxID=2759944 RepID=UPI0015F82F52|nr:DUF6520 family protein [Myroides sp. WP-1]MBB1137971.1 hypothetical protein [Myroides sp. WP-1]
MKKFFKTAAMPMAVFAIAIGSAFATNAMKSDKIIEIAYQKIDAKGVICIAKPESCDITGSQTCTWFDGITNHQLYGMQFDSDSGQTVCTLPLRRN